MTKNQIDYNALLETKRSNKAREYETQRSNRANEFETHRANVAREAETNRHNLISEANQVYDTQMRHAASIYAADTSAAAQRYSANIAAQVSRQNTRDTIESNQRIANKNRISSAYLQKQQLSSNEKIAGARESAQTLRTILTNQTTRYSADKHYDSAMAGTSSQFLSGLLSSALKYAGSK